MKGRSTVSGFVEWSNKPSQLDAMLMRVETSAPVASIALSADGTQIFTAQNWGHIQIFHSSNGATLQVWQVQSHSYVAINSIVVHPGDSSVMVTGDSNKEVVTWNVESNERIHT